MKEKSDINHSRLRRILLLTVIAVLVAGAMLLFRTVTNSIVDNITHTISLQYSQELNTQMSSHISGTLDYYFRELNTEYNALSLVENLDEAKLQKFIADTENDNGTSYLAFADSDGYVYESDGAYLGTMRVSFLGKLLSGSKRIVSDNITIGNESYIVFGAAFDRQIKMGDKNICIGLLGMKSDELADNIVMHSDYSGGYSSVIHTDGSFVVKNPAETKSGLNAFSILGKNYQIDDDELSELRKAIYSGDTYFIDAKTSDGADADYIYFAPIADTEWYTVNTLPDSFIKTSVVVLRNNVEKFSIVFIIFILVVAAIIVVQQMISSGKIEKSRRELQKALKVAEEASSAKTDFLFSMSHDIRTPMNAILGYTDIGLNHADDEEITKDSFRKIKTAGGHLLNLINDILEMSRIESGKVTLSEEPIDIREAIAEITTMSRSLAVSKSIDYDTVIGDIKNPYIYADKLHTNQVIINLISNAVKYTHSGGTVRYKIDQLGEPENGRVTFRFEVSDNGIGMSEEFQKHLFETFSREENTTISKTEGTGLGLSIVKRILDLAGGDIKVHSVQNEGSVFTAEIPFKVMDEQAISEFTAEKKKDTEYTADVIFAGKKVLLVEDNELNREIATYILEEAGLKVETAEDGSIAVNTVSEKGTDYYDFILMDIQMPVMDGYEATKKIRELPGGMDTVIIALSANAFEEDRNKSLEAGMNAHVAKPIDIKVLLDTMKKLTK